MLKTNKHLKWIKQLPAMIFSTTANVTLGENKTKNKQNNLSHASSWLNMVDRKKIGKTSGKSYTCSTGSESVKVGEKWGVERGEGWGHGGPMSGAGGGGYVGWHKQIDWPLLVERGTSSVNSDLWGSGLCHLAAERGKWGVGGGNIPLVSH